MSAKRVLMCAPDSYDLKYEINSWMKLENRPDLSLAAKQWQELYLVLCEEVGATVELVSQAENAPDMVFTANAGLVVGERALLSNFRHPERQVEVEPFRLWFEDHGFSTTAPPAECKWEGEGDALWVGDTLVAGYLKRSEICSHQWLGKELGTSVLSLELVDDRWYHLDTAFFALTDEMVAYHPGAFDAYAQEVIESTFSTVKVDLDEAERFACNTVVLGDKLVMPSGCPKLASALEAKGFHVYTVEMSEFLKSGGAAKCLTLHLGR